MYHIQAFPNSANPKKLRKIASLGIFSKGKTSSHDEAPNEPSASCPKSKTKDVFRKRKISSDVAFSEMMFLPNPLTQNISGPDLQPTPTGKPLSDRHGIDRVRSTPPEVDMHSNILKSLMVQRECSRSPSPPSQHFHRRLNHGPPRIDIFGFIGAKHRNGHDTVHASSENLVPPDLGGYNHDTSGAAFELERLLNTLSRILPILRRLERPFSARLSRGVWLDGAGTCSCNFLSHSSGHSSFLSSSNNHNSERPQYLSLN